MTKSRATAGRYGGVHKATSPGNPLPHAADYAQASIRHGAVPDPNPALRGQRQRVAINVRTDALENEYACGRISEAAYRAGRVYQHVLEVASGRPTGGGQWIEGDRVDAAAAHEHAILRALETARAAGNLVCDVMPVIGRLAANVLRLALIDRLTMTDIAQRCDGRSERMQVSFYAETFRRALEDIANHWARTAAPRRL